ncbi:MAG TPA: dihydrofolate reductase family protein [Micrococcaceae bacterium]|jgi:dihydrofolate reductase|nr:dihydrofolate reductase family protein [Micrococcaceae bacterium]
MTRTQYFVASSIDGFIAAPDGGLDWLLQFDGFEGGQESYDGFLAGVGAIIMGADTYRFLLDQKLEVWPYADTPVWVFSHTELPAIDGASLRFVSGDVLPVHREASAAAAGANVWLVGGGNLVAQFQQAGLLDDLLLSIVPVLLGSGRPLLPVSTTTAPLALERQRTLGSGVVELAYRMQPAPTDA